MKPCTYKTGLTISIGGGSETTLDLAITYTVSPGSPESGNFGPPENYDPGSPDELEIEGISFSGAWTGEAAPLGLLASLIEGDAALREAILTDWREAEASNHAAAMEDRADRAAEDRRERPDV